MKEYIKKFESTSAADDYLITDIPFTTSIATNPIQNLVCNQENKKIAVDGRGIASVVDVGPELISFTIERYSADGYGSPSSGPTVYEEQAESGMTFKQFANSDYNPVDSENKRYYECDYDPDRRGWGAIFFGENLDPIEDIDPRYWGDELYAGNDIVLENGKTYCYCVGDYCLLGDTEVTMADGSIKQIKDILVGDEVLSLDLETGEEVVRKVIFTDATENKSTTVWDEWLFSDGTVLKTAYRHEFFNAEANRFKYMDEWQIGEHTLKQDGTTPALIKHTVHEEVVNHYKITLEGSNNYFANGCLTGDRYCNDVDIKILKAQ